MSPKRFAMRLRTLRLKKNLTQDALAKRVGVTRGYLARLEMGRHDPPLSRLRKLAKALGVPVTEILG
jgi:transcriptional regulator with XRE-family HTH domain